MARNWFLSWYQSYCSLVRGNSLVPPIAGIMTCIVSLGMADFMVAREDYKPFAAVV
jgi:hypothetical protein